MKKYLPIILVLFLLLYSCSNDDDSNAADPTLLGKWKLIERLLDPGDGSGVFKPVESNMTLSFKDTDKVEIKEGDLCSLSLDSIEEKIVSYSLEKQTIDPKCANDWSINFEIKSGFLILYFPCFEACSYKFRKI